MNTAALQDIRQVAAVAAAMLCMVAAGSAAAGVGKTPSELPAVQAKSEYVQDKTVTQRLDVMLFLHRPDLAARPPPAAR
jgi:hypothetical protein